MVLPLLLAGPVVRRVDPKAVTVWVALSQPGTVQLRVWAGDQVSTGAGTVQSGAAVVAESVAWPTRAWGDKLFTATVTAPTQGVGGLTAGTIFAYDVMVNGQGLKELDLLKDTSGAGGGIDAAAPPRLALGYLTDHLPTFATPSPTIDGLRVAHTSCRKAHGLGSDALAWLDDLIEDHRSDVDERPQQLFLTGDQIYADDVAAPLLGMLQSLAKELLGYDETIVMAGGAAGVGTTRVALKDLPPLRRGRLCAEVAKLSSTDCASHLLGFGEFTAMYLAAWSPRVWRAMPDRSALFTEIPQATLDERHLTLFEKAHGDRATWEAADVEAEADGDGTGGDRARIQAFSLTVAKVARLLANCATYMVFDDHEITDDWYISALWRSRVLTSPLGRSVIRNGLMAYCVFQAPGNDPAKWQEQAFAAGGPATTAEQDVMTKMLTLLGDRAAPTQNHEDGVDELIGLASPADGPAVRFHYTVDGPRHRVVVLDTRTRRTYQSAIRHSPPKLLGDALETMLPVGPLTDGREILFVVSPSPVLFPRIFDALVQPAAAAVFDLKTHIVHTEAFDPARPRPALVGSEEWDIEGWGANEPAFHDLIRRLATYPRVVLLSGDVHFASSLVCDLWLKGHDVADSRIFQCTASSAKNEPSIGMRAVLRGQRSAQRLLQGQAVERLGWDGAHGVVLPGGAHIPPGRRGRLLHKPTFVPARGWPTGTTLAADKPPDVRYRVGVLRDERPAASLGVGAPVPPTLPAWNPGSPITTYAQVAGAHQQLLEEGKDPIRLMVFRTNVGVVSFAPSPAGAGEYVATHAVLSPVGDGTTGSPFTHHVVDLARAAAAAAPTLVVGS